MKRATRVIRLARNMPLEKLVRRLTLLVLALLGSAYALFAQDTSSFNTLCRAALTANLVQDGRIDVNGYEELTRDISFREGHYYCDKAPGMSFLATPAAAVFTQVSQITPEIVYSRAWHVFLYLCALTTSGLLCAGAGALLFRHLLARTNDVWGALAGAAAFGLATPVWGWATSFFSHAATAALLVMGFIALDNAIRGIEKRNALAPAALAGLALGGATAVEYSTLIPALLIGAALAASAPWSRFWEVARVFAITGLAAIAALLPVLWYHAAAFGSPFVAGYAYPAYFTATQQGLFGIGVPSLDVLGALLVSSDRGVVWYAPIVIAALWAAIRLLRTPSQRVAGAAVILVLAWYFTMNAGFAYWRGGFSTGPRYLTPCLGFAALAIGLAWPRLGNWERRGTLLLLAVSIAINFAATAVDMTANDDSPIAEQIASAFFRGDLYHAVTYYIFPHPSLAHFAAPLLALGLSGWLIWRTASRLRSMQAP